MSCLEGGWGGGGAHCPLHHFCLLVLLFVLSCPPPHPSVAAVPASFHPSTILTSLFKPPQPPRLIMCHVAPSTPHPPTPRSLMPLFHHTVPPRSQHAAELTPRRDVHRTPASDWSLERDGDDSSTFTGDSDPVVCSPSHAHRIPEVRQWRRLRAKRRLLQPVAMATPLDVEAALNCTGRTTCLETSRVESSWNCLVEKQHCPVPPPLFF